MSKDKQLKVRVSGDQLDIIRVNAKKLGLSVSQYVIDKCVHNIEACTQIKPIERVHKDKCVHKTKESIKPVREPQDKDNIIPAWKVRLLEQQAAIKAKQSVKTKNPVNFR